MSRKTMLVVGLFAALLCGLVIDLNAQEPQRLRGAKRSPAHKFLAAPAHATQAVPPSFVVVPPKLSYWGNNQYGNCVSAEEAAAKAMYSVMAGQTETLISDRDLIAWSGRHGWNNGAYLTEVMDAMISEGITSGGVTYKDGPYNSVDWTDDANLCSAIYAGPVKIGVAADQLVGVVGNKNGWFATKFRQDNNLDHCTNLCGYGTIGELAKALNVSVPIGVNPAARGYLFCTWSTIGIIDRPSLVAITGEAWLRNPTTVGVVIPPTPTPTPVPVPPTPTPTPVTVYSGPLKGLVGRQQITGTAMATISRGSLTLTFSGQAGARMLSGTSVLTSSDPVQPPTPSPNVSPGPCQPAQVAKTLSRRDQRRLDRQIRRASRF